MLKTVQGVYRRGRIELKELPGDVHEDTHVIVTFLEPGPADLRKRGIGKRQAAELRTQLAAFAEDWDSPEMDIYDNYDAAKTKA